MKSTIRKFNNKIKVNFKFKPDFLEKYVKGKEVYYNDCVIEHIDNIIDEFIEKEKILKEKKLSIIDYNFNYAKIKQRIINQNNTYLNEISQDQLIQNQTYYLKKIETIPISINLFKQLLKSQE